MYATDYTYVRVRAVYQMPHTEPLTVEPLVRPVESTLEGNNCIAVFVMNQAEDRWMLPVGFKLLGVKVVVRDVLCRCNADATDYIRKSAAAGAQFTTERQRRRRGHFRKLALSTDKFILNVISRR